MTKPHDWEADPRPITACLNEWRAAHGWSWAETAERIGQPLATVNNWSKTGRAPGNSRPTRIIMTLIDRLDQGSDVLDAASIRASARSR